MTEKTKLVFKIVDELSGIGKFNGTIDGNWVLFEYDQKTNSLWHTFDDRTEAGTHQLELEIIDKKVNKSTYKTNFIK